jgi:hypothetical protein
MEGTAIIMTLAGFFLLYGGLVCCIGIAWFHTKELSGKRDESPGPESN